ARVETLHQDIADEEFAILAVDYEGGKDSGRLIDNVEHRKDKQVDLKLIGTLGTQDYAQNIQQWNGVKVNAIWFADVSGAITFVKQAADFNLTPNTPLIGHALLSNFVINATDKALEGVPGNVGFTPDIETPQAKAFVAAFQEKHKR